MNLSQKITLKKTKLLIPKSENLFRLNFLNIDKRSEQTKKMITEKLTFGFQIELEEMYFCKCYYFIFNYI